MAKQKTIIDPERISSAFSSYDDMYDRCQTLVSNDPYRVKRNLFYANYNRRAWKRKCSTDQNKRDPNFGQFKSKIDAAMNTFVNVLTERNSWIKVHSKYPLPGEDWMKHSDHVTASFHKYFIRSWEDRFGDEILAAHDMVFFGKALEHWPSPGCLRSENLSVADVFPDTEAGMNVKKWNYVFVRKYFSLAELIDLAESVNRKKEEGEDEKYDDPLMEEFNKEYLAEIIDQYQTYSKDNKEKSSDSSVNGGGYNGQRDDTIPLIYAYVKDQFKKKNKVSLYIFPEEVKNYSKDASGKSAKVRSLVSKKGYCKCISQAIALRAFQISRSYYSFNSFAEQIYLATHIYDKSVSLVLRGSRRNSIQYWKSDNVDTQKKLMRQSDDEVQVIDPSVEPINTFSNNSNFREVVEIMRQIMIDTDGGNALAMAPGSQNVKGYAITAQEANLREQGSRDAEGLSIKVMMNQDVPLYREIYRRAVDLHAGGETEKLYKLFKKEMEMYNVPDAAYEYDSVYFIPSFLNGGSQGSRIANAQQVLATVQIAPKSPAEEQAQRDLIGALVGVDNVSAYMAEKADVNPVVMKAGEENELLDNTFVNPSNVPVMPDDKHAQEIPIHIADYEYKMRMVGEILKRAIGSQNVVQKIILLSAAQDLIIAQDNKGGHIQAHIQAMAGSKPNQNFLAPILDKFTEIQKGQDQLTEQTSKLLEDTLSKMNANDLKSEELRYMQAIGEEKIRVARTLNDIAIAKEVEKKDSAEESRKIKQANAEEDMVNNLAKKQADNELELTKKANELDHITKKQEQERNAAAKPKGGTP